MGFGGWIVVALIGVLVLVSLLLVAPLRLRVLWGETTKSFSLKYLGLSLEFDYACKRRRIRLLRWTVAGKQWPAESAAAPRPESGASDDPAQSREAGGNGIERLSERARLLWIHRGPLRGALLVVLRFLGRIARAWHVERADVKMVAGFGDPARTGMATGWFYSIWSVLGPRFHPMRMDWRPCFEQRKLSVDADIILRVLPLELVYHAAKALATLPWRALWKLRKAMRTEEELCRTT